LKAFFHLVDPEHPETSTIAKHRLWSRQKQQIPNTEAQAKVLDLGGRLPAVPRQRRDALVLE
jgi:hypothetical protein